MRGILRERIDTRPDRWARRVAARFRNGALLTDARPAAGRQLAERARQQAQQRQQQQQERAGRAEEAHRACGKESKQTGRQIAFHSTRRRNASAGDEEIQPGARDAESIGAAGKCTRRRSCVYTPIEPSALLLPGLAGLSHGRPSTITERVSARYGCC